jgi:hypothetical protein
VGRRAAGGLTVLAAAALAKTAAAVGLVASLALGPPATVAALAAVEGVRRYGRRLELWATRSGTGVCAGQWPERLTTWRMWRLRHGVAPARSGGSTASKSALEVIERVR